MSDTLTFGAQVSASTSLSDAVFSWCIRNARHACSRLRYEDAARWCEIAGRMVESYAVSHMANEALESVLRDMGNSLGTVPARADGRAGMGMRWLHVITKSFAIGGHTALCRRWIEIDSSTDEHHLLLTAQLEHDADPGLLEIIKRRGGTAHFLNEDAPFLERAMRLRELHAQVDVVVQHVHMWDPVPTIAFGIDGGAPVLMLNHADHLAWTGSSISDLILNIRPSGEALCNSHRGNDRGFRFPIPLPKPSVNRGDAIGNGFREQHNIPLDAPLFLTIGTAYKYTPIGSFSFIDAAKRLLAKCPNAHLLVIGPGIKDHGWRQLTEQTDGRAHVMGVQKDLRTFLAAADVYLEGFPFGSLTALLEAALAGIPPVLAPKTCPLPYRSDDFSLEHLPVANDIDVYIQFAADLASDPDARRSSGEQTRQRILSTHCEPKWLDCLNDLRKVLRSGLSHEVRPLCDVPPLPNDVLLYWANFKLQKVAETPFSYAFRQAMESGLKPRVDRQLGNALAAAIERGISVHAPIKAIVSSHLLSMLPKGVAKRIYFGKREASPDRPVT